MAFERHLRVWHRRWLHKTRVHEENAPSPGEGREQSFLSSRCCSRPRTMTRALLVLAAAALLLLAGAAQANDVSGCGGFVETSSLPK